MNSFAGMILQAAEKPPLLMQFLPFILIFFVFYFLLIRPQQKQQKERAAMLKAIEKGDNVVTDGGIHGVVTGLTDDVLTIEIAALKTGERIRVKIDRANVGRKQAVAPTEQKGEQL